jgi:hypothetical protein
MKGAVPHLPLCVVMACCSVDVNPEVRLCVDWSQLRVCQLMCVETATVSVQKAVNQEGVGRHCNVACAVFMAAVRIFAG